jgi:hypothetical protein
VRRSRAGWRWLDGVDAPLAEEAERCRVALTPVGGPQRVVEQTSTRYTYSAADRESDRVNGATTLLVEICQVGSFGLSRPSALSLSLM